MPLRIVRSGSNSALWKHCRDEFLSEIGTNPGPGGFQSHLWIAHRGQRDALFEAAVRRGLSGWFAPPISFLSELRERFGIRERPIGHLTGRLLVSRIAARQFRRAGLGSGRADRGPGGAHAIDGVFSELLPEGVTPDELQAVLERLAGDDFSIRRNRWVEASYREFLSELERLERFDPRSIHAIVARRIEAGELQAAIGGAQKLHVYGVTSLKGRRRLFRALAEQPEVEVVLYLTSEPGESEWGDFLPGKITATEIPASAGSGTPILYEAPDALREARWVAARIKALLLAGAAEPHEIAVIARSGGEDTRRMVDALDETGVPSTSRARWRLSDVAALRSLLLLFRGAAADWDYRSLRHFLASPLFDSDVDLRCIDFIAGEKRVRGLDGWSQAIHRLAGAARDENQAGRFAGKGIYPERLSDDVLAFDAMRDELEPLSRERAEDAWIALTLDILDGRIFSLRRCLSEAPVGRLDIVRADQRGVEALRHLLMEWRELRPSQDRFGPGDWFERLRRLLESNEIALTTPEHRGVQVLEAHEASLGDYRHAFVVHANDGVFPKPHTNRGVFSEEETVRLKHLGLPVSTREDSLRREVALWASVTAHESLVYTCRATAPDGNPRLPSLLIPEHVERWRPETGTAGENPGTDGPPMSRAQWLRWEASELERRLRAAAGERVGSIDPPALRQAILAAWAEELRAGRLDGDAADGGPVPPSLRPHPWGGELRDPELLRHLGERFGDRHTWSASQLEQYGCRPFDYLVDRVLSLRATAEVEDTTSPASRGALSHAILDRFFERLSGSRPTELSGEALSLFGRVCEEVLQEAESSDDVWLGEPALWRVTREQIVEAVRSFLEAELPRLEKDGGWPVRLELAFGDDPAPEYVLRGADTEGREQVMRVRGRIDRVDAKQGKDGLELRVLDYKWGAYPRARGYGDGSVLQMPIYMRAVTELAGLEGSVTQGAYRSITKGTANGALIKAAEVESVLAFALSVPSRVRAGMFEPVQSASQELKSWQAGLEVTRSTAAFREGNRYRYPVAEDEAAHG